MSALAALCDVAGSSTACVPRWYRSRTRKQRRRRAWATCLTRGRRRTTTTTRPARRSPCACQRLCTAGTASAGTRCRLRTGAPPPGGWRGREGELEQLPRAARCAQPSPAACCDALAWALPGQHLPCVTSCLHLLAWLGVAWHHTESCAWGAARPTHTHMHAHARTHPHRPARLWDPQGVLADGGGDQPRPAAAL